LQKFKNLYRISRDPNLPKKKGKVEDLTNPDFHTTGGLVQVLEHRLSIQQVLGSIPRTAK
jgi:hypothetical protein